VFWGNIEPDKKTKKITGAEPLARKRLEIGRTAGEKQDPVPFFWALQRKERSIKGAGILPQPRKPAQKKQKNSHGTIGLRTFFQGPGGGDTNGRRGRFKRKKGGCTKQVGRGGNKKNRHRPRGGETAPEDRTS